MKSQIAVPFNVVCIAFFAYVTNAIGSYSFLANASEAVAFAIAFMSVSGMLFAAYSLIGNIRDYFNSKK
jgi:hypothetical protein